MSTEQGKASVQKARLKVDKQLPEARGAHEQCECKYLIIAHWNNIRLQTAEL